jgi:hypothetical protein
MLFHQGLSLFFDRGGLYRLAAFDSHRGLDSLGDFLVQAGADLHRFLPLQTAGTAVIVGINYSSSGQSQLVEPRLHLSTSLSPQRPRETQIKSVRGECFPFVPSIHRSARGTRGERKMYRTTFSI